MNEAAECISKIAAEEVHLLLGSRSAGLTDDEAASYMSRQVRRLRSLRRTRLAALPWREDAARVEHAGLALHPFPVDPELPTLARALEPQLWRRLPGSPAPGEQRAVEVVHYPREGACVLRYHFEHAANGRSAAAADHASVISRLMATLLR